ncbi:MAG: hypothetical protein ACFFDV_01565 [Candidatus Thorarchaeota archaeon]
MSSDNKKSDEYWMGVRDALRMVDSFNKWAARNPKRAKSLDDFIHDGLIAAAKRCESCLREKLGLSFAQEDQEDEIQSTYETSELDVPPPPDDSDFEELAEEPIASIPDTEYEIAIESSDYDSSQEISIESDESSISIDTVERSGDEFSDDLIIEGPQRDFTSDFVLVEPPPLVVESDTEEAEESMSEEQLSESDLEELEEFEASPPEPEIVEKRTAFTWAEYEAAVTPAFEPEPTESETEDYSTEDDDDFDQQASEDVYTSDEVTIDEPIEPSDTLSDWSSYDKSTIEEEDIPEEIEKTENDEPFVEMGSTEDIESGDAMQPITEPPAPPPPPESEEDEEERKRRARRLFFGT